MGAEEPLDLAEQQALGPCSTHSAPLSNIQLQPQHPHPSAALSPLANAQMVSCRART